MTHQNTTTGADARTSFIETFAKGDKSSALRSLIAAAHSSRRFDGVTSDNFIYETLASGHIAGPVLDSSSSQTISA